MVELVGIADVEEDPLGHARFGRRFRQLQYAMLGGKGDRAAQGKATRLRLAIAGIDRLPAGVGNDAILRRAAGHLRHERDGGLHIRALLQVLDVAENAAACLDFGHASNTRGGQIGRRSACGNDVDGDSVGANLFRRLDQ